MTQVKTRMDLTQERVRFLFTYDPHLGELRWRNPSSNRVKKGELAGKCKTDGRKETNVDNYRYKNTHLIWLYEYGHFPEGVIDHINRKPNDDRLCNLRDVSLNLNRINVGCIRTNTSGFKGVTKQGKGWMAKVTINGIQLYLGRFTDPVEAAKEYDKVVREWYGPNICTNFS